MMTCFCYDRDSHAVSYLHRATCTLCTHDNYILMVTFCSGPSSSFLFVNACPEMQYKIWSCLKAFSHLSASYLDPIQLQSNIKE